MAKDTFYFSHDYNARNDEKIKKLIRKHGVAGYGIYWSIVEDLYNNANALQTDYDGIAFDLHTDKNIIESVINDFELFEVCGQYFGSLSVERRLNERSEKSKKARESASYRWKKLNSDANALQTHSDGNAIKERKGKEKKVKDNKDVVINYPNIDEVISYFIENGFPKELAQRFFNGYSVAGWKDSNSKQVKNWKQKAQNVWFKPENRITQNEPMKRNVKVEVY